MRSSMPWGPEKLAGFAFAAVLAEDGALSCVAASLAPDALRDAQQTLASSASDRSSTLAGWLKTLRPSIDERALRLPGRMRAILAPHCAGNVRKRLAQSADPARPGFAADEELSATVLRIARACATRRPQEPT